MDHIDINGIEKPKGGHIIIRIYDNGDVCEPTPCPGVWRKVGRLVPLPEKQDVDEQLKKLRDNGVFILEFNPDYKVTIIKADRGGKHG